MISRPWSGVEGDRILCYGLRTTDHRRSKAAGGVLTAKQAPHRRGTAPALGLRAGNDVSPFYRRPVCSTSLRHASVILAAIWTFPLHALRHGARASPQTAPEAVPAEP